MNIVGRLSNFTCVLALMFVLGVPGVKAGDIVIYKDQPPSANELADILFPETHAANTPAEPAAGYQLRFRGIKFDQDKKPAATTGSTQESTREQQDRAERPDTFGFNIQFAFNSAEIPGDARPFLDRVGEVLKSDRASGARIVIEGHTDAIGTESYNYGLSARRSESVRHYLIENFHINGTQLVAVAKGKSELLDPNEPNSSVNRRVQFRRAQ